MSSYRVLLFIFENAAKGINYICVGLNASVSIVLSIGAACTSDERRFAFYNHSASLATTLGFTAYTTLSHILDQPFSHCCISHWLGLLMLLLPRS